jgi:hypothetical protein
MFCIQSDSPGKSPTIAYENREQAIRNFAA